MKLATLDNGTRDGRLVVVSRDGTRFLSAQNVAPHMQGALDEWAVAEPRLRDLATTVEQEGQPLPVESLRAPLPRAYEWVDGSAYINHIILVRKARGAEPPATLQTDPMVYQGGSGIMLGPRQDIELPDPEWGLDFESEICVVLKDTPRGVSSGQAEGQIALAMLANDITFRNLIPPELAKGFGFF